MTPFNTCPACDRLNLPDARICSTCGAALCGTAPDTEMHSETFVDLSAMEFDVDTTPAVHLDAPELQRWFNSRSGGLHDNAHPTTAHVPAPPLPPLNLRNVLPVPEVLEHATPAPSLPPGVILADPQAPQPGAPPQRAPAPPPSGRRADAGTPAGASHAAASTTTKTQRRAQVRRKLLANQEPVVTAATPADVLVLESDDAARDQLCALLTAFGFRTHPVQSTMQAVRMLTAKRYAAAFLNIIFDGSAAPAAHDLCSRVKAPPPHANDAPCALIVVTGSGRPVERVRAELAGCDVFLLKPVSRGSVAQALEACGVPLPIDARRR